MPAAKLWIPALLVVGLVYAASAQRPAPADEKTDKPSAAKAADKDDDDDDDDDDKEKSKRSPLETFMRKKLDASSLILEGLCQEDADLIKQGADQLSAMSKVEVWNVLTDPEYREHSREFRDNAARVAEAAAAGDFDKAALRWFDVTMSCLECHNHVRGERKDKPKGEK